MATKPLTTLDPGSFRLLQIDRNATSDANHPVACRLSVHHLAKCPPFIALSYAWNDPQACIGPASERKITLDGQLKAVTPNLLYALRHLASQQRDGGLDLFWIDALCINQESIPERTAQVSIMHHIYRDATKVLVYLGPDLEHEAYTVREFFRALLQKYYNENDCRGTADAKKYATNFIHSDNESALYNEGLPPLEARIWKQVTKFWERAWFSRVWVQQEVAFAREVSYWCGSTEFTQEDLVQSSRFNGVSGLGETLMVVRWQMSGIDPEAINIHGRKVGCNAIGITSLQSWVEHEVVTEAEDTRQGCDRMTGPAVLTPDGKLAVPLLRHFADSLFLTFNRDCSDPRDRIFALLVLMRQAAEAKQLAPLNLQADYTRSVAEVFTETTAYVIQQTRWLGMLSLIYPGRKLDDERDMPSWVPDFCTLPPSPLLMFKAETPRRIASHFAMLSDELKPTVTGTTLSVSCKRIGVVRDIGNTYREMVNEGDFEATFALLLNIPDAIWPNYAMIDYWMDVIDCNLWPTLEPDKQKECRAKLRHWLVYHIIRHTQRGYLSGRITHGSEYLATIPSLEPLAQADVTNTLPTMHDWVNVYSHREKQNEAYSQRTVIGSKDSRSRRLFRLGDLGFPHCPAATVMGIGPQDVRPGDEVFQVIGSVMPLVLRPVSNTGSEATPRALVVGEAYMTGFEEFVTRMDHLACERWRIV
ncbi:heterokaryon incompatibility protein-domain-containing protein [Xylariaceae sp. FL1019]|nr:heterokaryon incompatibility protein-domain-containing protein [Xylariaceae sp. FL1019]